MLITSKELNYFSSKKIESIQKIFQRKMLEHGIDKEQSNVRKIREFMFEFFELDDFKNLYFQVALEIMEYAGIPKDNSVLQMLPTPRVFRPGAIGTSYHCDFWYGHGELSHTVWLPLTELEAGNTFKVINTNNPNELYKKLAKEQSYSDFPHELINNAVPVLPKGGEAYVFSSKLLHGSPLNTSNKTRLSFDFRLSPKIDPTSTKDLANYYHYDGLYFALPKHDLDGKRVLKYVCGGKGKNTFIQHIIIEAAAKRFNMNVSEQEAEIERFGYPIFKAYLLHKAQELDLEGLIIASKNILDEEALIFAKGSKLKIWCALENEYLYN